MRTLFKNLLFFAVSGFLISNCSSSPKSALTFDSENYITKTLEVDGQTISYRAYEGIIYVTNPVDTTVQKLNFYVPSAYYEGESINDFTVESAPIFLPNNIGGYMAAKPGSPGMGRGGSVNAAAVALSKGYVVASPGARGRTSESVEGVFTGKAPAHIVDLKSAVRYLRFNDEAMPGDAEKIISNGTSAGGALSTLLGATGNNSEYDSYLKKAGAADARDDIFAVSAYCPITNLDHADMAYEWQFNGYNDYTKMNFSRDEDGNFTRTMVESSITKEQQEISALLKAEFPEYVNSLELNDENGNLLTLDSDGEGSFKELVKSYVIASAQTELDAGADLSSYTFLTIKNGDVTGIDFDKYLTYITRMKTPPAFDALDQSSPENQEFGTATIDKQHFTEFGLEHSLAENSSLADAQLVKMMNPMYYIADEGTQPAKHWRIRHGTKDRDTSLAISAILATKLKNLGYDVDYALPWDVPHSGDYDLDELFTWMDSITK